MVVNARIYHKNNRIASIDRRGAKSVSDRSAADSIHRNVIGARYGVTRCVARLHPKAAIEWALLVCCIGVTVGISLNGYAVVS